MGNPNGGVNRKGNKRERQVGEPPASFPFEQTWAHYAAWSAACPNFYLEDGRAFARRRYIFCFDSVSNDFAAMSRKTGVAVQTADPDPEDTEAVRQRYQDKLRTVSASGINYRIEAAMQRFSTTDGECVGLGNIAGHGASNPGGTVDPHDKKKRAINNAIKLRDELEREARQAEQRRRQESYQAEKEASREAKPPRRRHF